VDEFQQFLDEDGHIECVAILRVAVRLARACERLLNLAERADPDLVPVHELSLEDVVANLRLLGAHHQMEPVEHDEVDDVFGIDLVLRLRPEPACGLEQVPHRGGGLDGPHLAIRSESALTTEPGET
jgi:hypothetical protein